MVSVLIVEDEVDLAANIATYLESFPNEVETVTAISGEEGVKVVEARAVDVILTDLRLPGMDGIELLRRALALRPRTKVVVMTAYGSDEVRSRALREGALRFIEKPVDLGRLRRLVLELAATPGGWSGSFRGLDMFDFTQLFAMARKSRIISASLGSRRGTLVFRSGELVFAATDTLSGAEAFFDMVEWEGGVFDDRPSDGADDFAPNVEVSTTFLLMEAARLRDERTRHGAGDAGGDEAGPAWLSDEGAAIPGQPAEPVVASLEPALTAALRSLLAGQGWSGWGAVVASSGALLAECGALAVPQEQLWGSLRRVVDGYPRRGLRRLIVEDGGGTVVAAPLASGRWLVLVSGGEERTGAISRRVERLVQALDGG